MTASTVIAPPANLAACEQIIERGLKSFTEVGMALMTIRDGRLYRASYPTFEAYCDDRWGFSRSRAHDLISSTKVTLELSAIADTPLPTNEGQARALNGLEPEVAAEVMAKAHQATNGMPTAAAIGAARVEYVDTVTGEILDPVAVKPEPLKPRRRPLSDGFRDASLDLDKLITRIENLVNDDRFPKIKNEVARYANDLIRARDALQSVINQMS